MRPGPAVGRPIRGRFTSLPFGEIDDKDDQGRQQENTTAADGRHNEEHEGPKILSDPLHVRSSASSSSAGGSVNRGQRLWSKKRPSETMFAQMDQHKEDY